MIACSLALLLAAQTSPTPAPDLDRLAAQLERFEQLRYAEHVDGLWARGRTYKARASAAGFTYFPALGADAPRGFPLHLRLSEATLGGEPLDLSAEAVVARDGDVFVLDRGPVSVEYRLALESVEQVFIVRPGAGAGDLKLDLEVESDLVGGEDGSGFRFEGPVGGVHYGAAIALDRGGRSVEVPATLDGTGIHLTVPAAFVAQAEGEVVVDPIIATFGVSGQAGAERDPDVAYDTASVTFIVVYEEKFHMGDTDLVLSRWRANGTHIDTHYVDLSTQDRVDPEVATHAGVGTALVVATDATSSFGHPIVGRIFDCHTGTLPGPFLTIADTGFAGAQWTNDGPDVGGSRSDAPEANYCVVWNRETFIYGGGFCEFANQRAPMVRTLGPFGTLGPIQFLSPFAPDRRWNDVRISETAGPASLVPQTFHVVAWTEGICDRLPKLRAWELSDSGIITDAGTLRVGNGFNATFHRLDVSDTVVVAGLEPRYAVAYHEERVGERPTVLLCDGVSRVTEFDLGEREHQPDVDRCGDLRWATSDTELFLYAAERALPTGPWDLLLTVFDLVPADLAVVERRIEVATDLGLDGEFGAAGDARYVTPHATVAYTSIGTFTATDVHGAVSLGDAGTSVAAQYCIGVPNSTGERGFLWVSGSRDTTGIKRANGSLLPPG